MAVVTLVTVMILVTVVTVVTVVTKKLNLPKTYLPTYLPVTVVAIRTVVTVVTEVTKKKISTKKCFHQKTFFIKNTPFTQKIAQPLHTKKSRNLS